MFRFHEQNSRPREGASTSKIQEWFTSHPGGSLVDEKHKEQKGVLGAFVAIFFIVMAGSGPIGNFLVCRLFRRIAELQFRQSLLGCY